MMSKLVCTNGDDYPEAAEKHHTDASILATSARHCGTAYLSGYIIECSLKSLILMLDRSQMSGHNLRQLSIKAIRLASIPTGSASRYTPTIDRMHPIYNTTNGWHPALRYLPATAVSATTASSWLIEPKSLRRALDRVSEDHVTQSNDEWPWLVKMKRHLKRNSNVPWERREIERILENAINDEDSKSIAEGLASSGRDLVDYLIEVGVFRSRSYGRVDVPDLFLAGLGLKRKGGVAKK